MLNTKSRTSLGAAKSSHLGNDLNAKIILIISALTAVIILVAWISRGSGLEFFSRNDRFLKFAPLISFILFNALPAIIQSYKNSSIVNSYYSFMQVGNTFPNFIDLKQTTGFLLDKNVTNIGDEGLIYPTFILNFRFLNPFLESEFALEIISFVTIILFALMIYKFSHKLSGLQNFSLALVVISPPFLLLIDRQNIDCLLMLLVYLGASIYEKSNIKSVFTIGLISLAALIKIYPIVILVYIFISNKKSLIRFFSFISLMFVIFMIYPDLASIQSFQINDMAGSAGLPVLMSHLAGYSVAGFYLSQPLLLLIVLLVAIQMYYKDSTILSWVPSDRKLIFVIFGSLILIGTLLSSTNYLYRLSYVLFLIPLIGRFPPRSFANISFLFFLFGIYLSPRSTGLLMNLFLFPFLIQLTLFVIKQSNFRFFKFDFTGNNMPNKSNN